MSTPAPGDGHTEQFPAINDPYDPERNASPIPGPNPAPTYPDPRPAAGTNQAAPLHTDEAAWPPPPADAPGQPAAPWLSEDRADPAPAHRAPDAPTPPTPPTPRPWPAPTRPDSQTSYGKPALAGVSDRGAGDFSHTPVGQHMGRVQRQYPAPQPAAPRRAEASLDAYLTGDYDSRPQAGAQQHSDEAAWSTAAAERTGPRQGWRAGLAKVGIKLAKSARELEYDRDVLRIQRKLAYPQNVVVVNLKGGVGKSTATVTIGSTLAAHRDVSDVVAFDSVTDGSLRRRMPAEKNRSVTSDTHQFLRSIQQRPLSGSEVQVQLYSNSAGLQALVAAQRLDDDNLDPDEFTSILGALHKEYMVNLIDTSPDRRVPTFWPSLHCAHAVVLVTTPNSLSVDAAKRFIDLLRETHYKDLLTRTVLLWNNAAPGKDIVIDVPKTQGYLVRQLSPQNDPSSCLVEIPMDPHLAAGGEINLALLSKETRRQFERAAALVMDKLPDRTAPYEKENRNG